MWGKAVLKQGVFELENNEELMKYKILIIYRLDLSHPKYGPRFKNIFIFETSTILPDHSINLK
jgi:hypothetical protein